MGLGCDSACLLGLEVRMYRIGMDRICVNLLDMDYIYRICV